MHSSNINHPKRSSGDDFTAGVSSVVASNTTDRVSPIIGNNNDNNNSAFPLTSRNGVVAPSELLLTEEESPENIRRDPRPSNEEIANASPTFDDRNNISTVGILDNSETPAVAPNADDEEVIIEEPEEEEDLSDLREDPNFTTSSFFRPFHFPTGQSFLSTTLHLRKQALSASFATSVDFLARVFALSAVGRSHSTEVLAGCGIGISAFNIISLSIAVGWASAIDTLASTAYGRLQKKAARIEEVGEITQLGLGLGLILSSFCAMIILLFSKPIVGFVFGEIYVESASEFLVNAVPFLISFTICTALFKSLQAQHLAIIPSKAAFFGLITTAVGAEILVPRFGVAGMSWTLFLASVVQIIACLLLAPKTALFRKVPWLPPTRWRRIFTKERILEYVRIAVPSLLSCSAEWTAFEILNILVARLGERETAAFGIFFNVAVFCWSLSAGVAIAAYSHVGKLLGEGKPMTALVFARTAIIWSWFVALCSATILTLFHNQIYGQYTKDPELMGELRTVLGLFWLYHSCDNVQYTIQAVFRGAARQDETVAPVLCSLWLIGLPSAYITTHYVSDSLLSLICGFCIGFALEIPLLMRRIGQWNWKQLAEEAAKRKHDDDDDDVGNQQQAKGGVDMRERAVVGVAAASPQ